MKLVIQIPCYNEEKTLPEAFAALPKQVEGFDEVEVLIIDDGSRDRTVAVARELGIHHIVHFPGNRGLARGFMAGLDAALRVGADVIVNTDADNQYDASFIPALVKPILDGRADMVIGDRQVDQVSEFSATKKRLQRFGSWVVRRASATEVPDATSGFRALSREAALSLFVTSNYTYTLETIIQAGAARLAITGVPVRTNAPTRESRLLRGMWNYVKRSMGTIIRIYTMYHPLRTFLTIAALFFLAGVAAAGRFVYYFVTTDGQTGHTQSLILAAILILASFQIALSGFVADLVGANRKLIESVLRRVRSLEAGAGKNGGNRPGSANG
ncbi:MAG: glycosyltransferase family 2 protein [Deltaproteobacteria bacterium]|nr:glycosyltransferase family 2 protein [Deltaproteobacteria bacterium]